jgi:hypothetical protein
MPHHHSLSSFRRILATIKPFQQFTGDLGLIEAAPTDDEPAVSKRLIVDATANRE